jgi:hypothetical protein
MQKDCHSEIKDKPSMAALFSVFRCARQQVISAQDNKPSGRATYRGRIFRSQVMYPDFLQASFPGRSYEFRIERSPTPLPDDAFNYSDMFHSDDVESSLIARYTAFSEHEKLSIAISFILNGRGIKKINDPLVSLKNMDTFKMGKSQYSSSTL